jgi:hypothetical protein
VGGCTSVVDGKVVVTGAAVLDVAGRGCGRRQDGRGWRWLGQADRVGGQQQVPAGEDEVGVVEGAAARLGQSLVEVVDLAPAHPIAEVALGEHPERVAALDHAARERLCWGGGRFGGVRDLVDSDG